MRLCSFFFIILLAACSSRSLHYPEIKTLNKDEVDKYYLAKTYFKNGLYSLAIDEYNSLLSKYPDSKFSKEARIQIADSRFVLGHFFMASSAYQKLLELNFNSLSRQYFLTKLALSHQHSYQGLGRDISPIESAIEVYEELINYYPNSVYFSFSKKNLTKCKHIIKEHHNLIKQFYEKKQS